MRYISKIFLLIFTLFFMNISLVFAEVELYLISGNPIMNTEGNYPTVLYHLNIRDKELKRIRPITTLDQGSMFVRPYHWENIVLIGSEVQPGYLQIDIIDMNNVMLEKSLEVTLCEGCDFLQSYFFRDNRDQIGQIVVSGKMKSNALYEHLSGVILKKEIVNVHFDWDKFQFIQSFGSSGGNVVGGDELVGIFIENGVPVYSANRKVPLNWKIPGGLTNRKGERFVQMLNTDEIRVITSNKLISISDNGKPQTLYYIFDKFSKLWTTKLIDGNAHRMRGINGWIVTEESYVGFDKKKELNKEQKKRLVSIADGEISEELYESALTRLSNFNVKQTGIIFLINVNRNLNMEFDAGAPDSEVLLIVKNEIYYRSNDKLKVATIENGKVVNHKVIFEGEPTSSFHWAFLSEK